MDAYAVDLYQLRWSIGARPLQLKCSDRRRKDYVLSGGPTSVSLFTDFANTRNEFEMAVQKEGLTIFWILVSSAAVEITERRLHFLKRVAQPVNNRGMCVSTCAL